LLKRYRCLREKGQAARLKEAASILSDPRLFVDEFARSVQRFAVYDNAAEHFYKKRPEHQAGPGLVRTPDVSLRLEQQRSLEPLDAADRLRGAGGPVVDVPARALAVEYVDRELLIHRTTSPSHWDDKARNVGGLRLDLLLASVHGRWPVVAELKTPDDMDPFFALIQVLACAAHLATPNQYERLRRHLPSGRFPPADGWPQLDVYVLTVKPELEGRHRYQSKLREAAEKLAARLLAFDDVARSVRRIVELRLRLDEDAQLEGAVRFGYERR
jgi:hypothetical protein